MRFRPMAGLVLCVYYLILECACFWRQMDMVYLFWQLPCFIYATDVQWTTDDGKEQGEFRGRCGALLLRFLLPQFDNWRKQSILSRGCCWSELVMDLA